MPQTTALHYQSNQEGAIIDDPQLRTCLAIIDLDTKFQYLCRSMIANEFSAKYGRSWDKVFPTPQSSN